MVCFAPGWRKTSAAVARAACNMGLKRLIAVQPQDLDFERMAMMATGPATDLLTRMEVHDDLAAALTAFPYVVDHGAAGRGPPGILLAPGDRRQDRRVFGPQRGRPALRAGEFWAHHEELPFCHALVTIPTGDCSSLNLGQAVLVHGLRTLYRGERPASLCAERLANTQETESMYAMLPGDIAENQFHLPPEPEHWMFNVRRLF